jgi:hypothetical protein
LFNTGVQLDAMANKTSTVFGTAANDVRDWAKANASAMGLGKTEAAGLAANFGDLLIPMGFTRDKAAEMSTSVVGLSGALANWSGGTKSAAEVSQILSKAMLGERDGLKELGIAISEEDVANRLAKDGKDKLTGAALEQAKALATQQLIMEKSTDAQAEFADGADTLIEKQGQVKGVLAGVKESMASGLVVALSWVIQKGTELKPILDTIRLGFRALIRDFQDPDVSSDGFVGVMERIGGALRMVADWVNLHVVPALLAFRDWVAVIIPQVQEAIGHFVAAAQAFWRLFGDDIMTYVGGAFQITKTVVTTVLESIKNTIQFVLAIINGDWGKAWDTIKAQVSNVWDGIKGIVSGALDMIRGVIGGAGALIGRAADGMWEGIKDSFRSALNWIIDKWNGLEFRVKQGPVDFTIGTPDIPKLAKGGTFSGMAIVGEQGPELISVGRTSRVFPNDQLASAVAALGSNGQPAGSTYNLTFTGPVGSQWTPKDVARAQAEAEWLYG